MFIVVVQWSRLFRDKPSEMTFLELVIEVVELEQISLEKVFLLTFIGNICHG